MRMCQLARVCNTRDIETLRKSNFLRRTEITYTMRVSLIPSHAHETAYLRQPATRGQVLFWLNPICGFSARNASPLHILGLGDLMRDNPCSSTVATQGYATLIQERETHSLLYCAEHTLPMLMHTVFTQIACASQPVHEDIAFPRSETGYLSSWYFACPRGCDLMLLGSSHRVPGCFFPKQRYPSHCAMTTVCPPAPCLAHPQTALFPLSRYDHGFEATSSKLIQSSCSNQYQLQQQLCS
mmetsp:Transcript_81/g.147  ORF Transcript_81/g.147 Transcript_81/m.147 type:complete len:240 (-) Transcript_81:48-767(-)